MIQLKILTGKMAGATWTARHFPVRIGRSAQSDLQIEENGVWDEHFQIRLESKKGFVLEARPDALVSVNGPLVQQALLRNGDLIEIGSWKTRFWLAEAVQRRLYFWETIVWMIVCAVAVGQMALIYWLIQ